jgi:hypothetical protein
MWSGIRSLSSALMLTALVAAGAVSSAVAQDASWRVSKASGEIWIELQGAQPLALSGDAVLTPGTTVRTGANGRVLLMRGAETVLVSPNSVMEIPASKPDNGGLATILQRSGSLLFDIEQKGVRHFEVATPYLAAVVKGTEFRVTVDDGGSRVEVLRGRVQVTDFKTGQRAFVNPEQTATVSLRGAPGLSLAGSGPLSPIELGPPQVSPVSPFIQPSGARSAAATAPDLPQRPASSSTTKSAATTTMVELPQGAASPAAATRWSQPNSGGASGWDENFFGWLREAFGLGRQRKDDDTLTFVAIPILVGLSVVVGAVALRRRRTKQQ